MGAFTSAVVSAAGIGLQAYGQFKSGADTQSAANYNADLYRQQAQIIDVKKGLAAQQADRFFGQLKGETVTAIAASGYKPTGSFLAVMNDNLTQAKLDKQTEVYNLEIQKSRALSSADEYQVQGKRAKQSGIVNAATTILTQGNRWYQRYGKLP